MNACDEHTRDVLLSLDNELSGQELEDLPRPSCRLLSL
jgi:hypothetical protein